MISMLRTRPTIIQFSPIRSGSTLVFNFLREIFPKKKIIKAHKLNKKDEKNATLVSTYRNPIDCISSNLLFLQKTPTEENIQEQIRLLKENGLVQLCTMLKRANMVLLKYEDFYHDHSVIFNQLESFFGIQLRKELQREISEKYQVSHVRKNYASQFSNAFEFDKVNHWHGNHISNFEGKPNTASKVFSKSQIHMIEEALNEYIELLGYTST